MALFFLLGFLFILVAGCLIAHPSTAPPPVKKEIRSNKPGPAFVWFSGHWKWTGSGYTWVAG